MKKLMDIISNWNKGKKAHDDRVAAIDIPPFRVVKAECILKTIFEWSGKDSELEAKHWQILAEYAQDQVKALTKEEKPSFNVSTTIKGGELLTLIERAEKRNGYGIQP